MSPDQAKTAIRVANVPQESPEVDGGEIRVEVSTRRPGNTGRQRARWDRDTGEHDIRVVVIILPEVDGTMRPGADGRRNKGKNRR
jgi:hypothetical protein